MLEKIIRSENLLWIVPILYGMVSYFTSYSDVAMLFFDNSYILLSFPAIVGVLLATMIVPYMTHLMLREIGDRRFVIAWAHIGISIIMVVAILFIFSYSLPINIKWRFYVGELPAFKKWSYYNIVAINIIQTFIILQTIYVGYGLVTLTYHYYQLNKQQRNYYNQGDLEMEDQEVGGAVASMIA
jgi:hypothetical protein